MNTQAWPRTAFVFPGQGSQYAGMARELASCSRNSRALVQEAEELTSLPVGSLMAHADARTIADPQIAQLLVFLASSVLQRELEAQHRSPAVVAGHSLGEYSALVAGGALSWHSALSLVVKRGRAMSAAARRSPGAMAAIVGLPLEHVEELCRRVSTPSSAAIVANVNSPRQAVVSGDVDAILWMLAEARGAGALRARQLPVGGAYHSPLMADAQAEIAPSLASVPMTDPHTPLVSSITGRLVTDIEVYRADLLGQITSPVRWQAAVASLASVGTRLYVEVGPGRVLTGLGREMQRGARHLSTQEALRPFGGRAPAAGAAAGATEESVR